MMAVSSRNMPQWIDVIYMYLYMHVVGLMNANNLINFRFSVNFVFLIFSAYTLASLTLSYLAGFKL
jgi:hypothetical protein